MNDLLPIHEKIKKERFKRFWSQRDLAGATGIMQPRIVRIESGQPTTVTTLQRVAEAFGMELVITMRKKK